MTVTLVDTSVLCELLEVPNMHARPEEIRAELRRRQAAGEHFVIPTTAIIETGNHIEHASVDRRRAAQRLVDLIEVALAGTGAWRVFPVMWDTKFLRAWCDGDSTADSFVNLAGNRTLGGGDMAVLVERDLLRRQIAGHDVRVWTLDAGLGMYP
jgi:hypothetical protein